MKSLAKIFSLLLFVSIVLSSNIFAQKSVTVRGQIVELKTFVVDKIKPDSPAGLEVTKQAFMQGGTFAFVENKTNKIFVLIPSTTDKNLYSVLEPYFGMNVFIKGKRYSTGGVVLLTVDDIGKSLK